jgi:hypothetical protein
MLWKPGQWKWMPVRHTENQAHPDWTLFYNAEDGSQPHAVADCIRRDNGSWLWRVEATAERGWLSPSGAEASADLAMKAAVALIRKEWEARA